MSFLSMAFNDRPNIVVDYTSNVDDVDARMVMLKPQNRTALIDAVYLGINKLKGREVRSQGAAHHLRRRRQSFPVHRG